ncbi:hypothetical protein [Paractinoplanes atraurantiacus]|uniref:hypothetical protein n=1 Tax=Paractinoplanes atraurantiacus TaxID=1036182 RepID=UPI003F68D344
MVTATTLRHTQQADDAPRLDSGSPKRGRRAWRNAVMVGFGLLAWLGLLTGVVLGLSVTALALPLATAGGLLVGGAVGGALGLLTHAATDARRPAGHSAGEWRPAASGRPAHLPRAVARPAAGVRRPHSLEVDMAPLPGRAVSYALTTAAEQRVGVVAHASGRRDVVTYDPEDLDRIAHSVVLTGAEAQAVAQMLGLPVYVDRQTDRGRASTPVARRRATRAVGGGGRDVQPAQRDGLVACGAHAVGSLGHAPEGVRRGGDPLPGRGDEPVEDPRVIAAVARPPGADRQLCQPGGLGGELVLEHDAEQFHRLRRRFGRGVVQCRRHDASSDFPRGTPPPSSMAAKEVSDYVR